MSYSHFSTKILTFLALLSIPFWKVAAKTKTSSKNEILKITYYQNFNTPKQYQIVQFQLQQKGYSEAQQRRYLKILKTSIIHYTLYVNLNSTEMLFSVDSISVSPMLSIPGYVCYIYRNPQKTYTIAEYFQGVRYQYALPPNSIRWVLHKNRYEEFQKKTCHNAELNDPLESGERILVWTDPPFFQKQKSLFLGCGPHDYIGAPGIILYAENFFGTFHAAKISLEPQDNQIARRFNFLKNKYKNLPVVSYKQAQTGKKKYLHKYDKILEAVQAAKAKSTR